MRCRSLLIAAVILPGCAQSTTHSRDIVVSLSTDEVQSVMPTGAILVETGISPHELDQLVKRFATERGIDFDFTGHPAHIVVPRSRDYLATVWYGGGIGRQIFIAKFGFDRQVMEYQVAIGTCCFQ